MNKIVLVLFLSVGWIASAFAADTVQTNGGLKNEVQHLQQEQAVNSSATAQPSSGGQTQTPSQPAPAQAPATASPALETAPQLVAKSNVSAPGLDTGGDLRNEAFSRMANSSLPMSPAQIELLRRLYDATQRASATYPGVPPRPVISTSIVNLSPGATPPVIRLGSGFVTSVVFVDSTGAPWPIQAYSNGNPSAYNIQWDQKGNILLIQAITAYRTGNLAVILKGLNTPVMIELTAGQSAMDMRVDMRMPGLGPNAQPAYETLPGTGSPYLLSLLDGIPPTNAKALTASACQDCAWLVGDKLYLRTQFHVISPAWISTMSSVDGTHVYEMEPTPVILASMNGKTIQMSIEGY